MRLIDDDQGSQLVEFGLVLLPLLAVVFLTIDVAWVVFAKSSLQFAVREGVRYAVTSQTMNGKGQDDSIRSVVQANSFGFLNGADGLAKISINYYDPATLKATNWNAGGNVVEVSVDGVSVSPMGPIFRSPAPLILMARSSDVMEGSPNGIPPKR